MKLSSMETAAKLSSKLQQNIQNRAGQNKDSQYYSSTPTNGQQNNQTQINKSLSMQNSMNLQQPNLRKLQSAKIGGQQSNAAQYASTRFGARPPQAVQQHKFSRGPQSAKPLKRLLAANRQRTAANEEPINLMRQQFHQNQQQGQPQQLYDESVSVSAEMAQMTQLQVYNRMQQAKLLGRHSNKFPQQMPEIKKRNATLSNLLRYPSPKSDKRGTGLNMPQHLQPQTDLQSDLGNPRSNIQLSSQQMMIYHDQQAMANRGPVGHHQTMIEQNQQNSRQMQVRIDGGQTQIFRDPKSQISPIISEGSQYSNDEQQPLSLVKKSNSDEFNLQRKEVDLSFTAKAHEVVETDVTPENNANIMIKDFTAQDYTRLQEPFNLQSFPSKTGANTIMTMLSTNNQVITLPQVKKEDYNQLIDHHRDLEVHGIHQNKQKLFFDMKQDDGTGKTTIMVPLAKQSKFGPSQYGKTHKEYRLAKLNDRELEKVMSDNTKAELAEISQIQKQKEESVQEVYFEDILTFPIELKCQKERNQKKRRNLDIGLKLQEEREQHIWEKREQKAQAQIDKKYRMGAEAKLAEAGEEGGAAAGMMGGGHFDYMNIDELKQHENGILNLFEGEKNIAKYVSHNKPAITKETVALGQKIKKYVRLSQFEYETIFEKDPSFNEKKAFVEVFRKKWKEDKGYCSMFDKRQKFRKAKSAALGKRDKDTNAHSKFKDRQDKQMLLNYKDKLARREQELLEKHELAKHAIEQQKKKEARAATLLFKKAMRRTHSPNPAKFRRTEMLLNRLPQLKQAENYDSNMFPLTKTDSLEAIMQIYSNKTQQLGMSALNFNPRAKSAIPLGGRKSIGGAQKTQPRVESSQVPHIRDFSAKPTTSAGIQSDNEETINLQGKQATMHQPLQNHDHDYLSNFITQMYQTTTIYNLPARVLKQESAAASHDDGDHNIKMDPVLGQQQSLGIGKDTVDDNIVDGTLGSIVREATEEFKVGTMKFDKLKETTGENTGRYSFRNDSANKDQDQPQPGVSMIHDKDIRIVTQPQKDRIQVFDQKNKKDLHMIQSQLDRNMLTFKVTRDPKSSKTLPIRKHLLLGQQDQNNNNIQYQVQKTIFSHRGNDRSAIASQSPKGVDQANGMQIQMNASVQSENKTRDKKNSAATVHLTVEPHNPDVIVQKEIKLMDSGDTNQFTSSGGNLIMNPAETMTSKVVNQVHVTRMFQNGDDHTALLHQRKSQLTDSKDSKLSDEHDMIHDRSFMQPKNNGRESADSNNNLTGSGGQQMNLNSAYQIGMPSDIVETIVSAKQQHQKAVMRNNKNGVAQQHRSLEPSWASNEAAKEGQTLPQQHQNQPLNAQNALNNGNYMDINSMTSGTRKDDAPVSRQNRVTVNSSYRSRPTNQELLSQNVQQQNNQQSLEPQTLNSQEKLQLIDQEYPSEKNTDKNISKHQTASLSKEALLVKNPPSQDQVSSNQDLLMHMSGSANENPFDEWTKPQNGINSSKLELLMKNAQPSVYNLPQNPMNHKSYKCNYIKSRVETTRMDFIHSQNQKHQFRVAGSGAAGDTYGGDNTNQDLAMGGSMLTAAASSKGILNKSTSNANQAQRRPVSGPRAMSASRPVSNAYLRNQKLVQMRKKEQQFCYYLQQHRQNKQLLESLEKQAAHVDTTTTSMMVQKQALQNMNQENGKPKQQLLMANSYGNLAIQSKQNLAQPKRESKTYGTQNRVKSQTRQQSQNTNPRLTQFTTTPVQGLMVSGTSGLRSAQGGRDKNLDIATNDRCDNQQTSVNPAWLETNSPHNRQVIEEAYRNYHSRIQND